MQDVFDPHLAVDINSFLMGRLGPRAPLAYYAVGVAGVKDRVADAGGCGSRMVGTLVHARFEDRGSNVG